MYLTKCNIFLSQPKKKKEIYVGQEIRYWMVMSTFGSCLWFGV